jgi:glycosyltransferase involved in cell wall biosynthesis
MSALSLPSMSIVTPCLDARPTLETALDSVRSQGYPDVEHLVVDGGSTDGSLEILAAAEGVDFTSEPDRGLTHAKNKGIERARGQVVGQLNADDFYLPGALPRVGKAFADHPDALWVTGPCLIVDESGAEIRRPISAYKNLFLRHYDYRLHLVQNFVSDPSTFVRRDAFGQIGLYDEQFRLSMDYELFLRLGQRGAPVVLTEPIAAFRLAGTSFSMTAFEQQFEEHALAARVHGAGHPLAVAANRLTSRLIPAIYRTVGRT